MSKKILVVGGVAGGATAISRMRRLSEDAEIILLEKGEFVSFANCGLPYYIGGVISERDSLFVTDIPSIEGKYGVKIRNFSEVIQVDHENKRVLIKDLKANNEYYESYDSLLLSTGSYPFVPEMKGTDNKNVFTLWNIPDTDKIYAYIKENSVKKALVAGGGFIGLEMAENLIERGIDVTLVEFADQIMAPLDKDMVKTVENHVKSKHVDLRLRTGLKAIVDGGKKAQLSDGEEIETDLIVLSIGVRPNTGFLKDSGIQCNERGGVLVDEHMQTNIPDVYAVGDMIEVENRVSKEKTMIPLAGIANRQGRAVAANILNVKEETFDGAIGTSVVKVFDLTIAATGENEKVLNRRGLKLWKDYGISLVHPMSHAGYYPGAVPLNIKLLFDLKDGRVLGAQIVGYDGVDKRIDTIATSIYYGGSVYDLTKIELAYAPPFSSAKDPVNMAGYYATDILEGLSTPMTWKEYEENKDKYVLVDVREAVELLTGKVENAINLPLTSLRQRYQELDKEKEYALYCAVGLRGYLSERILKQKGYKVRNILGGYRTYSELQEGPYTAPPQSVNQDKLPTETQRHSIQLDVCGLSCPGPIMSVSKKMEELKEGDILEIKSTDPGFARDIESWCQNTGNTLQDKRESKGIWIVNIIKGKNEKKK